MYGMTPLIMLHSKLLVQLKYIGKYKQHSHEPLWSYVGVPVINPPHVVDCYS